MRFKIGMVVLLLLTSCSKDNSIDEASIFSVADLPQTWELSSINAGLSGEQIEAEELSVFERYVFKENGRFSKQFQDDFTMGNADGSYTLISNDDQDYLVLNYDGAIDSLSYCSKDQTERLIISANKRALSNINCMAFDGPGMLYQRTN